MRENALDLGGIKEVLKLRDENIGKRAWRDCLYRGEQRRGEERDI